MNHIGIDYGSKLAGTTAICWQEDDRLRTVQSEKKKDADRFILDFLEKYNPKSIFIDAPLSLPGAYFDKGDDYFYRVCDRELSAMSPMFLGGLTARAMKLKKQFKNKNIDVHESYPGGLVKLFDELKVNYKKKEKVVTSDFIKVLTAHLPFPIDNAGSWHEIDAILCWWCGYRFENNIAVIHGDPDEGIIIT